MSATRGMGGIVHFLGGVPPMATISSIEQPPAIDFAI
jgi:hypothetical protein